MDYMVIVCMAITGNECILLVWIYHSSAAADNRLYVAKWCYRAIYDAFFMVCKSIIRPMTDYEQLKSDLYDAIEEGYTYDGNVISGFDPDDALNSVLDTLIKHQLIIVLHDEDYN